MLTLNYFASIREAVGRESGTLEMPDSISNVEDLIAYLVTNVSDQHSVLADEAQALIAVNQTVVDRHHPLTGDEEVAFFPPMTGG
jgi:molybdopterin synthase sulfur carrier subunit